jgi:zinc/manganese transport system permease protein
MRVSHGPLAVPVLAAVFGFVSAVGGILLAIAGTLPVSPYITTISFAIWGVCRTISWARERTVRAAEDGRRAGSAVSPPAQSPAA